MKLLKAIKKFFTILFGVIFFSFVIFMTVLLLNYNKYGVTQFGDKSLLIIKEELSSNSYKKGDLVIVKSEKIDKIQKGDEIFAYQVSRDGSATIDLGIVDQVDNSAQAISFENGSAYAMDFVIGKSEKIYNKVGNYLSIIESKWGFLFIILVPSFLIFIYQIYSLIVEIKYGTEDNEA